MMSKMNDRHILITRSMEQAKGFAELIRKSGAIPVFFPTIQMAPLEDYSEFDHALQNKVYDWIVFTSTNTVDYFFARLSNLNLSLGRSKVAAVGTKTAKKLADYHVKVDLVPQDYTALALAKQLGRVQISRQRILLPASSLANDELYDSLRMMGAIVDRMTLYKVMPGNPATTARVKDQLKSGEISCVTFFSPSAINGFVQVMGKNIADFLSKTGVAVAVIGPTTLVAARENGFAVNIVPDKSDQGTLLKSIVHYFAGTD